MSELTQDGWEDLRARAVDVMQRAYAPYSRYKVGAAARVDDAMFRSGIVTPGDAVVSRGPREAACRTHAPIIT